MLENRTRLRAETRNSTTVCLSEGLLHSRRQGFTQIIKIREHPSNLRVSVFYHPFNTSFWINEIKISKFTLEYYIETNDTA